MFSRVGVGREQELMLSGYRDSVWIEERVLWEDSGDGYTAM
jgi:hypothetical protein